MYSLTTCLSKSVLDFFYKHLIIRNGDFLFQFRDDKGIAETECWSAGKHLVPVSTGIWLVCDGFPAQIRHLFLSHSAADILCFCHHCHIWLKVSDNVAFAALGLIVSNSQINFLKSRFANAKFHTLFDDGITGRVTDCKIALWMKGTNANFSAGSEFMNVRYNKNKFLIPLETFSLSRFEKTIGIRSGIRTHKPKGNFNSYYDFFVNAQ